jgi:hypothetical protein
MASVKSKLIDPSLIIPYKRYPPPSHSHLFSADPIPYQVYMDDDTVKKVHIGKDFFLLSREGWGESKIPYHMCGKWFACKVSHGKCHACGEEAPPNLDMVASLSKYKE